MSIIVGGELDLFMVLDSGSPASAVSPGVGEDLHTRGLLVRGPAPNSYWLTDLRASEAVGSPALPDLTIRLLPCLARLRIDGLLGLDFLRQFERVCFQLSQMRLELTYASG